MEQGSEMAFSLGMAAKGIEQAWMDAPTIPSDLAPDARIQAGLQAVQVFLLLEEREEIVQERELFLTMCLAQAIELMEQEEKAQKNHKTHHGKTRNARGQKSEVRSQRPEARSQRPEARGQPKTEC